jgi:RNA polymerase-binding transcription factor DksA
MAKLDEQKKALFMEILKERKDLIERSWVKFNKKSNLLPKEEKIFKNIFVEKITEVKDKIDEVKRTSEYGGCSKCKKDMPVLDLEENPARQTCKKCEKKARKKK